MWCGSVITVFASSPYIGMWETNTVKRIISYSLFTELCNDFTCINVHILYNNQIIICTYVVTQQVISTYVS